MVDTNDASSPTVLKSSSSLSLDPSYASVAQPIKFPRTRSADGGYAHALYYPPTNPQYDGPSDKKPPLILAVHGGPTWQELPGLYMRDQFHTTRGYALCQLNYIGSAGYGRAFRKKLATQWGKGDQEDAVSLIDHLTSLNLIDSSRVGLTGHSAGGYFTMQGLGLFPSVYRTGIAESGISDLTALLSETHKFESRYLQPLCWSENATQDEIDKAIKERSPITHAHKIKAPMLIMGGKIDPICPPNQNSMLLEKIKSGKNEDGSEKTVEMVLYDGEGHIFLKGSTLKDMEVRREVWFRRFLVDE